MLLDVGLYWFCSGDAYVWVVCGFSFVFLLSFLSFVVFCSFFTFPSFFCLLDPFVRHQFGECESGIALLVRPLANNEVSHYGTV